jgi:hypothetical protein
VRFLYLKINILCFFFAANKIVLKLMSAILDRIHTDNKEEYYLSDKNNAERCLLLQILNVHITDLNWKRLGELGQEPFTRVFRQTLQNCPNIRRALINKDLWLCTDLFPRLDYEDVFTAVGNSWKNLTFLKLEDVHGAEDRHLFGEVVIKKSILKLVCNELPLLRYEIFLSLMVRLC